MWEVWHYKLNDSVQYIINIVCFSCTVDRAATNDELEDMLENNELAVFVDNVSLQ
jgi:hypothetical protein